jgi:hypothetical protein
MLFFLLSIGTGIIMDSSARSRIGLYDDATGEMDATATRPNAVFPGRWGEYYSSDIV